MRISKAVLDLWTGWINSDGSKNNLRIFVHGRMVKPTELLSVDLQVLRETFTSMVHPLLVHTSILRNLVKLQRSLDVLDIEGLSKLWTLSHPQTPQSVCVPPLGSTSPEPTISEWTDFVNKYLSSHETLDHTHPQVSHLRYYLLAYLLSATFKDCSIMLRINPDRDSGETEDTQVNPVTVIDLDAKSIDRLGRLEKLDKEIVESYTSVDAKQCVEEWKAA